MRESAEDSRKWLARFEAVDTSGFPDQEQLNKSLMVLKLKERIESYELKLWEMPVNQFSGIHLQIAQFVPLIPFGTTKDYEDYIARLKAMPRCWMTPSRSAN